MKKKSKLSKKDFFPVSKPHISNKDIKAVNSTIKKGWISSDGPEVKIFEKEFSKKVNRKFSIAVSNGTAALEIAIKALGIKGGHEVIIPNFTNQVYIHGSVNSPGATRYSPGQDISFYLNRAGGTLKNSNEKNIFIVHPNGETVTINNSSKLGFITASNKELIYPGSVIYVPVSTNTSNPLEVAAIWAPIVSGLALSITSLSVLNKD